MDEIISWDMMTVMDMLSFLSAMVQIFCFYHHHQLRSKLHTKLCICLQDILRLLGEIADARWGVYLRVPTQQLLEASLRQLHSAYSRDKLYRPVWISMEGDNTEVHSNFLSD